MADTPKTLVRISMFVAGLVALMAIADLAIGAPFSGKHTKMMDILFIISAIIVIYLGWDTHREMR